MNRFHIVVIGSLNADLVTRVDRFPNAGETILGFDHKIFPGGKGANQAYAAAKLGGRVSMVGQVGADAQGEMLKRNLSAIGVDVSRVASTDAQPTGAAQITINAKGENQIVIVPGANGSFGPEELLKSRERITEARLLLLQLEIPLRTVELAARLGKESGATVILDPAPAQQISPDLLTSVDYLTPNESELAVIANEAPSSLTVTEAVQLADRVRADQSTRILVKMGAQGAVLSAPAHQHLWPAFPVSVVDSTAAGDAFNAAFALALAEGTDETEAGRFACAAAACSVTKIGAQPSMRSRAEVDRMFKTDRGSVSRS